ncbi:hypothetical protein JMUB6875_31630 [Nocardia sp. JMUB6875]
MRCAAVDFVQYRADPGCDGGQPAPDLVAAEGERITAGSAERRDGAQYPAAQGDIGEPEVIAADADRDQ